MKEVLHSVIAYDKTPPAFGVKALNNPTQNGGAVLTDNSSGFGVAFSSVLNFKNFNQFA